MIEWKKRFWTLALGYLIVMVFMFALVVYGEDCEKEMSYCGLDPIPLNNSACEFCNRTDRALK